MDQFNAIKTVKELYVETHAIAFASTTIKGNSLVNHDLDSKIDRENTWSHKQSDVILSTVIFEEVVRSNPSSSLEQAKQEVKNWFMIAIMRVTGN